MTDQTKTIRNGKYRVELDRDKWYPEDPGADFPAMVYYDAIDETRFATWAHATEHGVIHGKFKDHDLTDKQLDWLWSLQEEISAFLPPAE